jgi:hypothetical protein
MQLDADQQCRMVLKVLSAEIWKQIHCYSIPLANLFLSMFIRANQREVFFFSVPGRQCGIAIQYPP